jgi:hypothetical protein
MAFGTICGGVSAYYSATELYKAFNNKENEVYVPTTNEE